MKNTIPFSIALLLCLVCTSCAGQKTLPPDLSAYKNDTSNAVIRLGMQQADVENLLGPGTFFDWDAMLNEKNPERNSQAINENQKKQGLADYTYGTAENYIYITYHEGNVIALCVSSPDEKTHLERSSWSDAYDVSYGASHKDIVDACGEPSEYLDSMQVGPYTFERLTYYYDASGSLLKGTEGASTVMEYFVDKEKSSLMSYSVASYWTP